jgi:hypothetical protein
MKISAIPILLVAVLLTASQVRAELSINPPTSEVGSSVVLSSKGDFDLTPVNNQITFTGNDRARSP